MDISKILAEIDAYIAKLQEVRAILSGGSIKRKPGRPATRLTNSAETKSNPDALRDAPVKRRKMSPETRKKMADAQRLRWANSRNPEK